MTKADIIKRISEEQGIDQKTVALVIEGFMKCVKDALGRGRSVFLRGFGTFSLKKFRLVRFPILNPRILFYCAGKEIIENRLAIELLLLAIVGLYL